MSSRPELGGDLLAPPFAGGAAPGILGVVADLLPAGAAGPGGRDLVVLADGLGRELLDEHLSLAPTLRRLAGQTRTLRTVTPATTATAMTSLLTGLPPIRHGVLGYTTIDPERGVAVNQLTGDAPHVDPVRWMPQATLGESSTRRAVHVGPLKHSGSHLSAVAFRGWDFVPHRRPDERVDAVRTALQRAGKGGVVHLHVDDVDHAGHRYGVDSDPWREAVSEVDALLATLLRRLPPRTRIHLTADHGMVDVDPRLRLDPTALPGVRDLVAVIAGESRAMWIGARGGEDGAAQLAELLREGLGERALVLSRAEVIAAGVLGPPGEEPAPHARGRMGDVLVLARGRTTLVDPGRPAPRHPEIGVHGSLTARESLVPLLSVEV
ncbi:alkaline phosphatase family protein [Brachybacterium phenoliresistens]|uniref:AP endonuclease n=1 Tax=Brachybacterium phenoliresistens TaxID=396014 RepID=Z9JXZ0_9MICO|nr:alkaline phosphatase family protein [Brachybacterium phenoliresistens]EWS82878.1 AP endonuclease [Brachybacterium phenoliresistens]